MLDYQTVVDFKIRHLRFLDKDGNATQPLPDVAQDKAQCLALYRHMYLTRAFDNKAISLQRTGRLGTYAPATGQEAVTVGIGYALEKTDVFVPYYRDVGTFLQRQVSMVELLQYWGGDEQGCAFQHNAKDFPPCIPIATQCLHAAGVATAMKCLKEHNAVLVTLGDGATSKGDFYEAMNIAGLWYLPLVFVINNNQWAISMPRAHQTHSETLAQKAIACGLSNLQVDGNDIFAVTVAVEEALNKARKGKGGSVIEALSYRLCDHTTADDASRYCPKDEREAAWQTEPLARFKTFLVREHSWTDTEDAALQTELKQLVETAANEYLALTPPKTEDMFDYVFAHLTPELAKQRAYAIEHAKHQGEQHG